MKLILSQEIKTVPEADTYLAVPRRAEVSQNTTAGERLWSVYDSSLTNKHHEFNQAHSLASLWMLTWTIFLPGLDYSIQRQIKNVGPLGEEEVEGFDEPDVREDCWERVCCRVNKAFAFIGAVVTFSRPAQDHVMKYYSMDTWMAKVGHHEDPLLVKSYWKLKTA